MFSVSDSIQSLAAAFSTRQGQPRPHTTSPTTPQHRTMAIQCLSQIDRDLSVWTCSAMITLFQENIPAADTYMALDIKDTELH